MSQRVADLPPNRSGKTPLLLGTKRRKLVAGALAATVLLGAMGIVVAMRPSTPAESEPVVDVPYRDGDAIVVSDTFRAVAGLETVAASSTPLVPLMHAVGTVAFDPTHVAAVGTRAAGVVQSDARRGRLRKRRRPAR